MHRSLNSYLFGFSPFSEFLFDGVQGAGVRFWNAEACAVTATSYSGIF